MPALNFQKQFVEPILDGTKTSTIRLTRKDNRAHCKPGQALKLYTGMRTKQCKLIKEVLVKSYRMIVIRPDYVVIDGDRLTIQQERDLAATEGFAGRDPMFSWFEKNHHIDEYEFIGWQIQWEAL